MASFQKESLSLAETNRVRISLGLAPLDDEPAVPSDVKSQAEQDAESERNYAARRKSEQIAQDEAATRERITKAKNRRELVRKLRGPTLGEESPEEGTRQWVKAANSRAKEHAARRQREMEEAEAPAEQYSASDLDGLRVAHDLADLGDGNQEHILTLRDGNVLDEGEDELVDATIAERARASRNNERKGGVQAYTGLDDESFDTHQSASVLGKYDDVESLDAREKVETRGGFRIGDAATVADMDARTEAHVSARRAEEHREQQRVSLDYVKNVPVSDYAPNIHFKKGKKKRHASRVQLDVENATPEEPMPADVTPQPALRENVVDDDELAASLARARRQRAKRTIAAVTPEMLAKNLAAKREAEAHAQPDTDEGITFDETSEFVRQLAQRPMEPARAVQEKAEDEPLAEVHAPLLAEVHAPLATHAEPQDLSEIDFAATQDEPDESLASEGVAAALRLLKSQGILEQADPMQHERESRQLQYDAWVRDQKRRDEEARHTPNHKSSTREYDARNRDKREAEEAMARFKDYTPDVTIAYHDEFGRTLTPKEAWKRMSHVFHGNKPGYKAQEKQLRRIENERRREQMLAGDTSALTRAFQERSERTGQAHMVLSVGNKDNAPREIDLLGHARETSVVKAVPKAESKRKEKRPQREASEPPEAPPASAPFEAPPPKPVMKPAFGRIQMVPVSSDAPEAPAPREKIRISLGKRKAQEGNGV
ncbi:hypothetical protein MVES1_002803 [Malassezia vespertilionis]|uniref:SART-1 protein n=1 Tax=Malassezia vespertilionis TaxID=2020962 RepID=A0A2N1JAE0_9BASI|nr:uncharacterized protein MVES1_002803 [Malassezia vespertilionis]PKI83493.1 hypothetical protein MVES_002646 [Malassezia vespertilionis]WFD07439.1 hypothetical protein MVES1_002803 [Malassezia vespertilionis]